MSLTMEHIIDRYKQFTQKSLEWCIRESEESTSRVSEAIDMLLKNTNRVSELSEESITAIEGMANKLKVHLQKKSDSNLEELIATLRNIADEHDEIKNVIHPIIQSLQFQDRLRQNLENIEKMIPFWLTERAKFQNRDIEPQELIDFGNRLMEQTTMSSERDVIRSQIAGLKDDEAADAVMMF